jgi:glycosyltransferase involved in cell wall biosynthesis
MKVLVMGNGEGFGGAQTAYRGLIDFLREEGHQAGGISITSGDDGIPDTDSLAFYHQIGQESNAGRRLRKYGRTLLAAIAARKFRPEVFIAVGLSRSADLVAALLTFDCYRICQDFIASRPFEDSYFKSSTRHFDAVAHQAPSMTQSWLEGGFTGKPMNWLPCFPIGPTPGLRRTSRPERTSIKLAYFGRLAPNKGLELFLEALPRVDVALPIEVHIWGAGSERERLEAHAAAVGVAGSASFMGSYPTEAAGAALMCSYDALVLPSTGAEGLPLILLEAMAYGIPMLTTNVGAVRDCCTDNPDFLLVDPTSDGLTSGLDELLHRLMNDNFDTERLQAHYTRHFSREAMSERWRECLRSPSQFFRYGE